MSGGNLRRSNHENGVDDRSIDEGAVRWLAVVAEPLTVIRHDDDDGVFAGKAYEFFDSGVDPTDLPGVQSTRGLAFGCGPP